MNEVAILADNTCAFKLLNLEMAYQDILTSYEEGTITIQKRLDECHRIRNEQITVRKERDLIIRKCNKEIKHQESLKKAVERRKEYKKRKNLFGVERK